MGGVIEKIESLSPQAKSYFVSSVQSNSLSRNHSSLASHITRTSKHWTKRLESKNNGVHILTIAAYAYQLNRATGDAATWEPLIDGQCMINLNRFMNDNYTEKYIVTAYNYSTERHMGYIFVPDTKVSKHNESANSIFWEDRHSHIWGIRFLTEGDALRFLAGCSPPTPSPPDGTATAARYDVDNDMCADGICIPPLPDEIEQQHVSSLVDEDNLCHLIKKSPLSNNGIGFEESFRYTPRWKEQRGDLMKSVLSEINFRKLSIDFDNIDIISPEREDNSPQAENLSQRNIDNDGDDCSQLNFESEYTENNTSLEPDLLIPLSHNGEQTTSLSPDITILQSIEFENTALQQDYLEPLTSQPVDLDVEPQPALVETLVETPNKLPGEEDIEICRRISLNQDLHSSIHHFSNAFEDSQKAIGSVNVLKSELTSEKGDSGDSKEIYWNYPKPLEEMPTISKSDSELNKEQSNMNGSIAELDEVVKELETLTISNTSMTPCNNISVYENAAAIRDALYNVPTEVSIDLAASRQSALFEIHNTNTINSEIILDTSHYSIQSSILSEPYSDLSLRQLTSMNCTSLSEGTAGNDILRNSSLLHRAPLDLLSASKNGWLEVRKYLFQKKQKMQIMRKQKWKRYWCTLKGASLILYNDEDSNILIEERAEPQLCIDLEGSIVQAAYECIRRSHVFSLSLINGTAYYMQALSQRDEFDWIQQVHCTAAIACTRQLERSTAIKKLRARVNQIEYEIDNDTKLKNMAKQRGQYGRFDFTVRDTIKKEILNLDLYIESLQAELYRLALQEEVGLLLPFFAYVVYFITSGVKCYLSSLSNDELPNPNLFLASISLNTKLHLTKLGSFTSCTAYTYICSKQVRNQVFVLKNTLPSIKELEFGVVSYSQHTTVQMRRSKLKQALELVQQTSTQTPDTHNISHTIPSRSTHVSSTVQVNPLKTFHSVENLKNSSILMINEENSIKPVSRRKESKERLVNLNSSTGEDITEINVTDSMRLIDVLLKVCINKGLNPQDYFIKLQTDTGTLDSITPPDNALLSGYDYISIELCPKATHTIDLYPSDGLPIGLQLDMLENNIYGKMVPSLRVTEVGKGGQAEIFGLMKDDEIISLNNKTTEDITLEEVNRLLNENSVRISFKTKRQKLPYSAEEITLINNQICPAPPINTFTLSNSDIRPLVIPRPSHLSFISVRDLYENEGEDHEGISNENEGEDHEGISDENDLLLTLIQESKELNHYIRLLDGTINTGLYDAIITSNEISTVSYAKRLMFCAYELLDTEKEFVQSLELLVTRYLEPLKEESFLSKSEFSLLYGNTDFISCKQAEFLNSLINIMKEVEEQEQDTAAMPTYLIHSISDLFINYYSVLRKYSSFCTSYRNAQEIINNSINNCKAFFEARNPHQKPSLRFDSLLALPIQRILRYPLFLRNMRDCVGKDSPEYEEISLVIQNMDRIAGYIDEVQFLSEKFASLFETLLEESGLKKTTIQIDVTQLKNKFDVVWLNPVGESSKWKKGAGPEMTLFLFPHVLVIISYDSKFKLKLMKHGVISYQELSDNLKYKYLLPLYYCDLMHLPDSDGVINMVLIRSNNSFSSNMNLIIRCRSRPDKMSLIQEFKSAVRSIIK